MLYFSILYITSRLKFTKLSYLNIGWGGNKGLNALQGSCVNCISCTAAAPEQDFTEFGVLNKYLSLCWIECTVFHEHTVELSTACAQTVALCGTTIALS